ncbi:MAG: hypothetical protein HQK52_01730 [Oligoflexia bacterium]|nr:hypothetical protein [Oligoflexia bacterium]
MSKFSSIKRAVLLLLPVVVLLLLAEGVCRIKFYFAHNRDSFYLTTPFNVQGKQNVQNTNTGVDVYEGKTSDVVKTENVLTNKECSNSKLFSKFYNKEMDVTHDENCFRGDRVDSNAYKVFIVGDSTVEDSRAVDKETFAHLLKAYLPEQYQNKRVTITSAGRGAYGSASTFEHYEGKLKKFNPDMIVVYIGWNEQVEESQFVEADGAIASFSGKIAQLHQRFHYKSMLYTYLVEKYHFASIDERKYLVIDLKRLQHNFSKIVEAISKSKTKLVVVSQLSVIPRYYSGVDTFDTAAVEERLRLLQSDKNYKIDAFEVLALNQRLAVVFMRDYCLKNKVPYINLLADAEAVGDEQRKTFFQDLAHTFPEGNRFLSKSLGEKLRPFFN